jgi:late competence protein required for DNA uptake (superfamily II DNA/RNA helicase)
MAQVMHRQTKKLSRNTAVQDIKKTNITHRRHGLSSLPVFQYIEAWKQVLQQQQPAEEDVDCGAQTA